VQTYKEGKAGIGLGCLGSRSNTRIEDGEMVMGVPIELLADVVSGLNESLHLNILKQEKQTKFEEKTVNLIESKSKIFEDKVEKDTDKIVGLSQTKPVEITEIRKLMPCIVDPSRLRIIANMIPPLGETLKILEPIFPRSRYLDRTRSLIIEKEEIIITVYGSGKVSIGMIQNESEAREVLEELRVVINEAIKRGVVPASREKIRTELLDIYKYLPQTNCGKCSEQDCYNFAIKLMAGEATLEGCKLLKQPKYATNQEHLQVLTAYI
jgi:ArsR family metal-binding transcriptional regulator